MGLFDNIEGLNTTEEVQLEEEYVSGGSKYINEAGVYTVVIKKAYGLKSSRSQSQGLKLELETEDGKLISWSGWFLNAEGKPYYVNAKGEKKDLIALNQIYGLNKILNGKSTLPTTERRTMEIQFEKDPKEVDAVVSWMGKPILICVKMVMEDSYKDKNKSITNADIEHFADPVDERFASEKPDAEPTKLQKFKDSIANGNTTRDNRNHSKNESGGAASTPSNKPKF